MESAYYRHLNTKIIMKTNLKKITKMYKVMLSKQKLYVYMCVQIV